MDGEKTDVQKVIESINNGEPFIFLKLVEDKSNPGDVQVDQLMTNLAANTDGLGVVIDILSDAMIRIMMIIDNPELIQTIYQEMVRVASAIANDHK